MTLKEEINRAIEELKDAPETLTEALPDIMYISDVSEESDCDDDDQFFGASTDRDDLVGGGGSTLVGIYKLIAVQKVERYEKTRILETEFSSPGQTFLDINLGKGGVTVAEDTDD